MWGEQAGSSGGAATGIRAVWLGPAIRKGLLQPIPDAEHSRWGGSRCGGSSGGSARGIRAVWLGPAIRLDAEHSRWGPGEQAAESIHLVIDAGGSSCWGIPGRG